MGEPFRSRFKKSWNAFFNRDPTIERDMAVQASYSLPRQIGYYSGRGDRSILNAAFTKIAIDCAAIKILHVKLDSEQRYTETINSDLNNCLTIEANIDQSARAFRQDAVMTLFDKGVIALVPTDTDEDPDKEVFDIYTMRVGVITEWYPRAVKISVYNDRTGQREEIIKPKEKVAIIENPLYSIINEPNSTFQRLNRKLNLLDVTDERMSSGKLDLIIQLPFVVRGEIKRKQAEQRKKDVEDQLVNSPYGIAYTDGTERITQLNRPVENNLLKQVEYLTNLGLSQIGITQGILDGSADESTMLNYMNRTVEPIVAAITDGIKRTFLTKTARTQGQSIMYFQDPFRLVTLANLAEISDKFTRNEILSPNEIRQVIGIKPSKDPKADELRNRNISQSAQELRDTNSMKTPTSSEEGESQNG